MPTISGPSRICKKFREFKRTLKVRIWDSSGVITVGKGGWEGEPRKEGGRGEASVSPPARERGLAVRPGNPGSLPGP